MNGHMNRSTAGRRAAPASIVLLIVLLFSLVAALPAYANGPMPKLTVPGPQFTDEDTPLRMGGFSLALPQFAPTEADREQQTPVGEYMLWLVLLSQFTAPDVIADNDLDATATIPFGRGILVVRADLAGKATLTGNYSSWIQAKGSIEDLAAILAGGVTYRPNLNFFGMDYLVVAVGDRFPTGLSEANALEGKVDILRTLPTTGVLPITVRPVNDPPIAVDDWAETLAGQAVDINVLANDPPDIEGDIVTVATVTQGQNGGVEIISGDTVR